MNKYRYIEYYDVLVNGHVRETTIDNYIVATQYKKYLKLMIFIAKVSTLVISNNDVLMQHWNNELSDFEALKTLKELKSFSKDIY